jgi:hypothetical protein
VVFRLVHEDPPDASDFATHAETGRLPKAPACLRCGLSVFREKRDAEHQGELDLAYWCDGDAEHWRYVVVPTTPKIVASLRAGKISVSDALDRPRCWVCDVDHNGRLVECRRVDFDSIPRDALPAERTMLLPTQAPAVQASVS